LAFPQKAKDFHQLKAEIIDLFQQFHEEIKEFPVIRTHMYEK